MRNRITKILILVAIISIITLCFVACYVQKSNTNPQIEINSDGYWVINGETTTVKAQGTNGTNGKDGITPTISINKDGFWVINGETTTVKAQGKDGTNGTDGTNGSNGKDGITPTISINQNGYWVINGNVTDVKAQGKDGVNGTSINKVILDKNADGEPMLVFYEELLDGTLTEKCSINIKELCGKDGIDGDDGITPTISIDTNGYWVINGETTDIKAQAMDGKNGTNGTDGTDGKDGKNIFELYKEVYGYDGTVDEWLKDVLNGTLDSAIKHTVTFDYNGCIPLDEMPSSVEVVDGRTIELPEPTRDGYNFLGWYVGNGVNDGQWLNTLVVSRDLNLVARWQGKEFEVRFETSTGVILKIEKVKYGSNATAPEAPHVEGCIFDGWDGETENITSNRILHPLYTDIEYTITYVTDGGSSLPNNTYLYNEIPTAPQSPSKTGFFFVGWKLENAEDSELYVFDTPLTNDITLVAVWTDTIVINDVAGLKAIGSNLNAKYALDRNINLNGEEWTPLGEFKGTLDGKGYKIYNFVMNTATSEMGFFKKNSGTIKNIVFSDISISNAYNDVSNTAIVTATNNGEISGITIKESTIQRTYSKTNASHNPISTGGITGTNNGTIKDSSVDVSTTLNIYTSHNENHDTSKESSAYYGSISGLNYGVIENIIVINSLNGKFTANSNAGYWRNYMSLYTYIGGAVGMSTNKMDLINVSTILNLTFVGEDNSPTHYRRVGGIVGDNKGEILNSSSVGSISTTNTGSKINDGCNDCGGIAGDNNNKIHACMSSVSIENKSSANGPYGGITGFNNNNAKISDCIFNGMLNSNNTTNGTGGIVGYAYGGIISNCIMLGTIKCNYAHAIGGITSWFGNATITRCVIDGKIIANSGTPQYIAGEYSADKTVTKCYRTENATLTVGEETIDGSQGEIVVLKPSEEIYTAEFFFETLLFNEDIWAIDPDGDGVYLKTLKS